MLIVLDLDETLLHSLDPSEFSIGLMGRKDLFSIGPYWSIKRPGLDKFLNNLFAEFDVAVWSSASKDYVEEAVDKIFKDKSNDLKFAWSADRCVQRFDPNWFKYYWVKDLKKVRRQGYNLEQVIAVDDTPRKYERHYGNLVRIKEFYGDPNDDWLPALFEYLVTLKSYKNVRRVEKRGWRSLNE